MQILRSWKPVIFLIIIFIILVCFICLEQPWIINIWENLLDELFGIIGFLLSIVILLKQYAEEKFKNLPFYLTIHVYHNNSRILDIIKVPLVAEEDIRAASQSVVLAGFNKSRLLSDELKRLDIDYMAENHKNFNIEKENGKTIVHYTIQMVLFSNPLENKNIGEVKEKGFLISTNDNGEKYLVWEE